MSGWRIVVKNLYAVGGSGTAEQAAGDAMTRRDASCALQVSAALGLTRGPGKGGTQHELTQRGIDWCEGRVDHVWDRPGGRRWVCTWLASLPRGIRIERVEVPA